MSTQKILYPAASSPFTVTHLNSLVDGNIWSGGVQDNTSNLYVDGILTWIIKMGTSPTAGNFVYPLVWEILDDSPTYPDVITGAEETVTPTSVNVLFSGAFKFFGSITVDSTSSRLYYATARLSQAFGNAVPKKWGPGFYNKSGATMNASGQVVSFTPIQYQSV